jgi:NitT/TauT family transport system substrate-binding protein
MKRTIALALLVAVGMLSACSTPTPAAPAALETIRLPMGYLPSVQYAPFYVADAKGYFAEEGLALDFDYAFETDGVKLVGAGDLPFSLASGEQVLLARQQGLPVVYVMGWWQGYPVAVAATQASGITRPSDLVGRTVGIPMLGGASYVGYAALLSANHLPLDAAKLQVIGFTQVEALQSGQLQAAVVYTNNEPVVLANKGVPLTVLKVSDYVTLASNGVITNEVTIRDHPELVRRFVRATVRGLQDTLDDPQAAFEICKQYVEGLTGETEAVQRQVLDESLRFWKADRLGYSQPAAWENMQQVLLEAKLLSAPQDLSRAYTNEFVP